MKFLLVDDDVILLKLMAKLLEHEGHTVHVSHAARSAVIDCADIDFDYLISDLEMLGMSGQELVTALEQEIGLDRSKVIVVSGSADKKTEDELVASGIAAFIPKPIDPNSFASQIGEIVS